MADETTTPEESKNTPAVTEKQEPGTSINTSGPANTEKLEFGNEIRKMIATGGTLEMTQAQKDILYAPIKDEDVLIRPDGKVYLSWIRYSKRITDAFGGTGWVMIPEGMPKLAGNLVVWGFHLVIKGVYCGFAIGEQAFYNNGRMTYGEACEGAKSNSLMRLCKALGIGLELWDETWAETWVSKYAESYPDEKDRTKKKWKMKNGAFGKPTITKVREEGNSVKDTSPVELRDTGDSGGIKPNTEFISGPAKSSKKEQEIDPAIKPYYDKINTAETLDILKSAYNIEVIEAHKAGTITDAQREVLKTLANKKFVLLKVNAKKK